MTKTPRGGRECRYRQTPLQSHRGLYRGLHRVCIGVYIGAVIAVPSGLYIGVCIGSISGRCQLASASSHVTKIKLPLQLELLSMPEKRKLVKK